MSIGQKAAELQGVLANAVGAQSNFGSISEALEFTATVTRGPKRGEDEKRKPGKTLVGRAIMFHAAVASGKSEAEVKKKIEEKFGESAFAQAKLWNQALASNNVEGFRLPVPQGTSTTTVDESAIDELFSDL